MYKHVSHLLCKLQYVADTARPSSPFSSSLDYIVLWGDMRNLGTDNQTVRRAGGTHSAHCCEPSKASAGLQGKPIGEALFFIFDSVLLFEANVSEYQYQHFDISPFLFSTWFRSSNNYTDSPHDTPLWQCFPIATGHRAASRGHHWHCPFIRW